MRDIHNLREEIERILVADNRTGIRHLPDEIVASVNAVVDPYRRRNAALEATVFSYVMDANECLGGLGCTGIASRQCGCALEARAAIVGAESIQTFAEKIG